MNYLISISQYLVFAIVVFVFAYALKKVSDYATPFDDDLEIEEHNNLALALSRVGMYLGLTIGMAGAISSNGTVHGFIEKLICLLTNGAVMIPLLLFAKFINDRLIISAVNNNEAILKGNIAVGIAEFGSFVGSGLIMYGATYGDGGTLLGDVIFFLIGQVVFVIIARLFSGYTKYDINQEVARGNVPAGIEVAAMFIAVGFILKASIAGPFTGWAQDITQFLISAVIGIVFVIGAQKLISRIFLPKSTLETELKRDRNISAIIISEGILVAIAIVFSMII